MRPYCAPGLAAVDLLQQQRQAERVPLRRQAAVDRAGAEGHQHLAAAAELAQHLDVLGVAHAALDDAHVALAHFLDVGERRAVELDPLQQGEEALVDVEERHVAAEAAGQRRRGDLELAGGGASMAVIASPRPTRRSRRSRRRAPRWASRRTRAARSACRSRGPWAGSRPPGRRARPCRSPAKSVSASRPVRAFTMSRVRMPRPESAKTFLRSTSRLARTHSEQRMQRLKSSSTSGCEASTGRSGKKWSKCGDITPRS